MLPDKIRTFALLAKPKILELHHYDDWIIVIGLNEVHLVGSHSRHRVEIIDVRNPASMVLHDVVNAGIVSFYGRKNSGTAQASGSCGLLTHHKKGLSAGARHYAIIKEDR